MPADITVAAFGLACWEGRPLLMDRSHRHHELELNYLSSGTISYSFGGAQIQVVAGQLALFWAAMPHQIVALDEPAQLCWVTLPLALFLHWQLPAAFVNQVLHGQPIVAPGTKPEVELARLRQWQADLAAPQAEQQAIVVLELEARLRRMALAQPALAVGVGLAKGGRSKAEQIAQFIAGHHAEPLRAEQIAAAVGLHPRYAMTLFRQVIGMSIGEYLTQYRLMHAQRLLATTDASVLDVALDAGFGSSSRFYAAFKRACGCSPGAYRAALPQR
jgi:AraC-like DNA-binding protein